MDTDDSVVMTTGKGGVGEAEGGRGEMVMEGDLTWVVNTQYKIQMTCYRMVLLKLM